MAGQVSIEESQLGQMRWAVIITRPGCGDGAFSRSLWERYVSQAEAEEGAKAARTYLANRPTSPPAGDR